MSQIEVLLTSRPNTWCTPVSRVRAARRRLAEVDGWLGKHAQCVRAVRPHPELFPAVKHPVYNEVAEWCDQVRLDDGDSVKGLILYGPAGTGKTMLAAAALLSFAAQGLRRNDFDWPDWNTITSGAYRASDDVCPAYFYDTSELLRRLSPERLEDGDRSWYDYLRRDITALVLDDIGLKEITEHRADVLKAHVEWSAGGRVLILTTNVEQKNWEHVFGDRLADRFQEARRFKIMNITGQLRRPT